MTGPHATLTVTDSALARLAGGIRVMPDAGRADACFRLTVDEEDQLALAVDSAVSEGHIFQYQQLTVLVISDQLAERYAGRTLDVNAAGDFVLS